jgi:hypothetical protein
VVVALGDLALIIPNAHGHQAMFAESRLQVGAKSRQHLRLATLGRDGKGDALVAVARQHIHRRTGHAAVADQIGSG